MHYIAYLIPPLVLFAHWVWTTQYGGHPKAEIEGYAIALGVMEALVGLAHYIARHAAMDTEYLSGFVTEVRHYREWTELQVYYVTVRDSRGNTRQERRTRTVYHPEYWTWTLNTGHTENISHQVYTELVYRWGGQTSYFHTFHPNCIAGGGGDLCPWDGIERHVETQTYTQRYDNPLDQSNSIFRYEEITQQQAQELGLYEYPRINGYEQTPIVGLGVATPYDQRAFQLLNAQAGSSHQVHFFVLLYDASLGLTIAEKQRAYWHGGNKNEFTICLGIEHPTPNPEPDEEIDEDDCYDDDYEDDVDASRPILRWCNAFSWMDEPRLELALESWARDHTGQPLDLQAFCQWLRNHLDLWQRKEWKDFKYIANPMKWWQLLIVYGTAIASGAATWYVLLHWD